MKKKILIIGSLNMDLVIPVKDMPRIGETVLGKDLFYNPGGKGANQAAAVGRIGGNAVMLGCVGEDDFGEKQIANLASSGVDTSCIRKNHEQPTGMALIQVNEAGNNSIVVIQGANTCCDTAYLKEQDELLGQADYILLQMEIPQEAIYYVVSRARELWKCVVLNPAPAPDAIPDEILQCLDYITPNETELFKLSGVAGTDTAAMEEGARILRKRGVKHVVVTAGEYGAFYAGEGKERWYPAKKVKPIDTTAAGDCFNGALLCALAEGQQIGEAITFANAAASIAVTRKGAQSSIPDYEEVLRRMEE